MAADAVTPIPVVDDLTHARQIIAELCARNKDLERRNAELQAGRLRAQQDFATATHLLELTGELAKVGGWQVEISTMKLIWTRETFRISEIDSLIEPDLENGINLFAPAARPIIADAIKAAMEQGKSYDLELPIITAKGRHRWVRTQGYAIMDGGTATRLIGTFQDITHDRETRENLREIEAHHSSVFDSLTEHIAVLDHHGVIVAVNQAWRQFSHASGGLQFERTAIGVNYLSVCQAAIDDPEGGQDARKAYDGIRAVLSGEQLVFIMEYPCALPNELRWFKMQVSPMVGARRGVVVSHADITERKRAETAMAMARREMENQQFAMDQHAIIAVTDVRGRITHVNERFCAISEYAREELLGRDHRLIKSGIHPVAFYADLWSTITSGQVWHGEICNRAKTGKLYWVSTTIAPMRDSAGKVYAFIAIRTEVTQQKQAEARLLEAKERADDLNAELKLRIAQANDLALKAERASEIKSAFLANMSHEIRTPMNGIMGMLEVLLGTQLSPEQEDYIQTAYHSTESLMTIVNDVLDFSKLEANRVVLENIPFDVREKAFHVAELFRPQLTGRPLEMLVNVAADVPSLIMGDPARVRQILTNLVSNAVKFTKAGHVRIDVSWTAEGLVLAVSDTGIGIPEEQLDRLFVPFSQVDASHSRKFGGTGLGLVISLRFATLMKGTLTVSSTPGKGSTFTAVLPLEPASAKVTASGLHPVIRSSPWMQGMRVLVVDDLEASAQLTCEMLSELGIRGEVCDDGAHAFQRLKDASEDPFAAAILDLRMKGMTGIELAQAIRKDLTLQNLPLLMVTGSGQADEPTQMANAGFNGYLVKPVRFEVLTSVLATIITRCRAGDMSMVTRYDVMAVNPMSATNLGTIDADVLLVEDHEVNLKIATVTLGKLGARVSLAEHGQAAVVMVQQRRYDVILMDCQMPVMDGFEATQAIRQLEREQRIPRVPIIAMTANVMPGSRERCLAAGMDDFLAKPFKAREIADKIRYWVHGEGAPPIVSVAPADVGDGGPGQPPAVIDLSILQDIERADPGMAVTILQIFQSKLRQDVETVRQHFQAREFPQLNRVVHKIKGSSGSIGALALQAVARLLEAAALSADPQRCRHLVDELERTSRTFLDATRLDAPGSEQLAALLATKPSRE